MRVLICTNDSTFNVSLAAHYRARGHDVHVSQAEFFLRQVGFELIHFHWPEELTAWKVPPSPTLAAGVLDGLAWWRERGATLVCTVHNLLPHVRQPDDMRTPAYFSAFYGAMHRIGHFSVTSRDRFVAQFPQLAGTDHVVHGMNLFDNLRQLATGRSAARAALGAREDGFLMMALGSIRSRTELLALTDAVDGARVAQKQVFFAARGGISWNRIKRIPQQWHFRRWLARHKVILRGDILPDREMVTALEAADVLLIPRPSGQINSGLLPLAMTFGTPVVAPDHGVFREMLSGTGNGLYDPGDRHGMARAIEAVAARDHAALRAANLELARTWGWQQALDKLLAGIA